MTRDAVSLLAAYDAQLRGQAEVAHTPSWDRAGPLWRAVYPGRGFVSYESLAGYDLVSLVHATVAYFADQPGVASFEWKTRGHDDVPDLDRVLGEAGFVADDVETVMVGEAAGLAVEVHVPDGVVVRRIDDLDDPALAAANAVQAEVFGGGPDLASIRARLEAGQGLVELWVAESEGSPVSCGRLDVVPGTEFAGLWGGVTLPAWRGRGVYRALTSARARSAIGHGASLLHSDCTAMSRPILERSGLVPITTTTPYVWTRP